MGTSKTMAGWSAIGILAAAPALAQTPSAPLAQMGNTFSLEAFGPISTVSQADAALKKAAEAALAAGGGVVLIPENAPQGWKPDGLEQNMWRKPEAPAPAKNWGNGPGVTVIDARRSKIEVPEVTGMEFNRTFSLAAGQSSPHWQYHPMLRARTGWVAGTSNYSGMLLEAVVAGKAQKFYLDGIRGVFPGQALQINDGPRSLQVMFLGFDKARKLAYVVADAEGPVEAGARLSALTTASVIAAQTRANNETQTFDVYSQRAHYSQGDTYMFDGYVHYMGDEYGIPDKENAAERGSGYGSVIYNARTRTATNIFRGQVAAFDAATGTLKYTGATNAETLATGRPLINMNPQKWTTAGKAQVNFPGGATLNWGGSIWSADAPWTPDLVGQYFALDEENEKVPNSGGVRCWFLITDVTTDGNGRKRLSVRRHWWGAKNLGVGISTLQQYSNYTQDEKKPVPLRYVIAPGSYVNDVAHGAATSAAETAGAGARTIKVAPSGTTQTALDFAPGDQVEQAIGSEPFHPIVFRAWTFDEVPGVFPAPVLDVANYGANPRSAVLSVTGTGSFNSTINLQNEATVKDVFQLPGDIDGALFDIRVRKNELNLIAWTRQEKPKFLSFFAHRDLLSFNGPWDLNGSSAVGVRSLGKAGVVGSNFRGIDVEVPEGAKEMDVSFPAAEPDNKYALTVSPGWMTERAVTGRTPKGFKVQFGTAAPAGAKMQWLLVR